MAEARRRTKEMNEVAMAKFAEANPHLVATEHEFYANNKEQTKMEDEEMDRKISDQVDREFDEFEMEGILNSSEDEEEVTPSNRKHGEACPSGRPVEVISLDDENDKDPELLKYLRRHGF